MAAPTCPICGGDFVRNIYAPERLVCRACAQSFDGDSILKYWDGEKYAEIIRNNPSYPAAAAAGSTSSEDISNKTEAIQRPATPKETLDQAEGVLSRLWFSINENAAQKQSDNENAAQKQPDENDPRSENDS